MDSCFGNFAGRLRKGICASEKLPDRKAGGFVLRQELRKAEEPSPSSGKTFLIAKRANHCSVKINPRQIRFFKLKKSIFSYRAGGGVGE
ncbi:hypothetical protein WJR50_07655 [Catalinimonas sp. 4WD22]|uniref:hypothetical protein n=1 Tax=Catalinimonas locisalis TaxID=3133978 RepID=UPI0031013896